VPVTIAATSGRFVAAGITNTSTTDIFIDEMVMVPITSAGGLYFPQDLFQQFINDRTTMQVL
jgi:hypothetical protein